MRNLLLALAALISLTSNVPYIIDTWRGKTKPNIATWSTWTLINVIVCAAAIVGGGAVNTISLGLAYFVGAAIILLLAFVRGTRHYTRFDTLCQILAVAGVILWLVMRSPATATSFAVMADALAALPSLRHAYFRPYEETLTAFLLATIGSGIAVMLASPKSFIALAFPLGSTVINASLTIMITARRRQKFATEARLSG